MLRISGPRTGGYHLLSGRIRGLPAASTLVSARLGIDGALSLRYLCSWSFLLSTSLLPLSCSLSAPASVDSRNAPGPSPALSAPRMVVVKMRSCLVAAGAFFRWRGPLAASLFRRRFRGPAAALGAPVR